MQIHDRVVLITGGKRIGAVAAEMVAVRGADVALSYNRSAQEAEAAAGRVREAGRRAVTRQADLTQPRECAALVEHVAATLGRLDVLVNMASTYQQKPFDALTPDDLMLGLSVDLGAAYHCSRAAVPHMRQVGGGRIINFSDWTARSGRPRYTGYLTYYVAKTAVIGLTEALALELAPDQILVNAIAPGPILAPPDTSDSERQAVERATPLGRWGGEEQIGKAIVALIETDFVTGETIRVDGGRHVK